MSKISDALLHEQDIKMEYYGKFMDHIYDVLYPEPRLSDEDINQLELDQNRPNPVSKQIISTNPSNYTEINKRKIA